MDTDYTMTSSDAHYPQSQQPGGPQGQQTASNSSHVHRQQQQQWAPPHLLPPVVTRGPSSFPSPVSPAPTEFQHTPFYHGHPHPHQQQHHPAHHHPAHSGHIHQQQPSLSLNISSLSVASPSGSAPPSSIDPGTPISPASASQHSFHPSHLGQPPQQQTASHFSFQDHFPAPRGASSASSTPGGAGGASSGSTPGVPRKRSFTSGNGPSPNSSSTSLVLTGSGSGPGGASTGGPGTSSPLLEAEEDSMFDDQTPHPPGPFDDMGHHGAGGASGMYGAHGSSGHANGGGISPVDGAGSSGDDLGGGLGLGLGGMMGQPRTMGSGLGGDMVHKPLATNNFVTKLYQMINDPKSASFIEWTTLGTSFVVSNVGEFSRSILGSHFKHNNFSSFVRQLNMYGFHKINRTPRAQRSSTDAQTWEFSHRKFLRGRPDLLDEIKRKALEPDPGVKQRVELPGEVAAQLGSMREENQRLRDQLHVERRRSDKLVGVVKHLWEVVGKSVPGLPAFPPDLLELSDNNPNILVTSPTDRFGRPTHLSNTPPSLSAVPSLQSLHSTLSTGPPSLTPNSSPTAADFPNHSQMNQSQGQMHHAHADLSRTHGTFSHISLSRGVSPSPVDMYGMDTNGEGMRGNKRPRTAVDADDGNPLSSLAHSPSTTTTPHSHSHPHQHGPASAGPGSVIPPSGVISASTLPPIRKGPSRARSDSAPLGHAGLGGYAYGQFGGAGGGRPRSGSGLGLNQLQGSLSGGLGTRGHGSLLAAGGSGGGQSVRGEEGAPPMLPMLSSVGANASSGAPSPVR